MEIVDNFVNPFLQEEIERIVYSEGFPWNYCKIGTTIPVGNAHNWFIDSNTKDSSQFTHNIYTSVDKQNIPYEIQTILYCMEDYFQRNFVDRLLRIKLNMLIKDPTYLPNNYHIPHSDYVEDSESAIYYVNNSDGDTFLFNERADLIPSAVTIKKRITPVKGRLVLFDSSYLHASSSPVISSERIVINFVFKK
jgi:hypothetical protein